jgi:hydrogenase-4 component B
MSLLVLAGAVLVVGAALALALPRNGARALAAVLTQAAALALAAGPIAGVLRGGPPVAGAFGWAYPLDVIALRVDPLAAFFLAWSLPMVLLGTIYGAGYLRPHLERGRHGGPHFALLNMTSVALLVVYSAENALVFLLGWEIAVVAAWLMIIWEYASQKIRFAAFNYLVSAHVGLFVLVAAFMLMYAQTGSMDLRAFGQVLGAPGRLRGAVFLLLLAAFALKAGLFPFHTWLPRAHSAAPAHVSALLSGVISTSAGLFGVLRFTLLLGRPEEWMGFCVLAVGAASAFFGVLYCAAQRDLKRLLGYSSTENVGIAAIGFGVGYLGLAWDRPALAAAGFAGGLMHVMNHAIFKCLLFYAAGAVYRATHTVDLERLGGLLKRLPAAGWSFLAGAIAIAALPPLNGFAGEIVIYSGLLSGEAPSPEARAALAAAAAMLAFVGAVGALAMVRAFGVAFLGSPRDPAATPPAAKRDPTPLAMRAPMLAHAAAALVLGVFPVAGFVAARSAAAPFLTAGANATAAAAATGTAAATAGANATAAGTAAAANATAAAAATGSAAGPLDAPLALLAPIETAVQVFVALALALCLASWLLGRRGARVRSGAAPTWGCGYTATNARMQYTGSSFSAELARVFLALLPVVRRERLPRGVFPAERAHLGTHHVDAVERRIFEVLGQGEDMITSASGRIPEQPRFAFAAGLLALILAIGFIVGAAR